MHVNICEEKRVEWKVRVEGVCVLKVCVEGLCVLKVCARHKQLRVLFLKISQPPVHTNCLHVQTVCVVV
jgi:hypothetical protein